MQKQPESKMRIQYQDCDPFNHLNNSKYIDYMMSARSEQILEHYGFNTSDLAYKERIGWVAVQNQITYFQPALWMEMVIIDTKIIHYSRSTLVVEAMMWNEDKTVLKAVLWTTLVHYDLKEQKSREHSAEHLQLFEQVLVPISEGGLSFDVRIKQLRSAKIN
jgi:acyl-CoA thioester hydrolase